MAIIYISEADGQQSQYSEHEARLRWTDGRIPRHALFWRHGMPEWRPAVEHFEGIAPPEPEPPPPLPPPVPVRMFAKDPARLTQFLVTMLRLSFAASVIATLLSAYSLASGQASQPVTEELTPFQAVQGLFALIQMTVLLLTGVGFLRWIHRAHVNARALGATGMTISPGWAVGWFFIPIMNLWKPLHAMKELWQASSNPTSWQNESPAPLVNTWWTLWLLSNLLGQIALRLALGGDSSQAVNAEICSLVAGGLDIVLAVVAIRLVQSIIDLQSHWVGKP